MDIKLYSPHDWLGKIKVWCDDEDVLRNLTFSQKARLAEKLSFFFINVDICDDCDVNNPSCNNCVGS